MLPGERELKELKALRMNKTVAMNVEAWKRLDDLTAFLKITWPDAIERAVMGAWQALHDDQEDKGKKFREFLNEKIKKEDQGILQ